MKISLHAQAEVPAERAAFEILDRVFSSSQNVLELELLPTALSPDPSAVLQDGSHVGIPKALLLTAFKHVKRANIMLVIQTNNEVDESIIMKFTRIMLLMDPEYLTAANARKRHLLSLKQAVSKNHELHIAVKEELVFLDTLVNSRLKRHTKSPTLWNHRRWLVTEFYEAVPLCSLPNASLTAPSSGWVTMLKRELRVIARAGEFHPKNYTAWDYARKLFELVQIRNPEIAAAETNPSVRFVHAWCSSHVSDISGWSFLTYLLELGEDYELRVDVVSSVVNDIIRYQFKEESIWTFVCCTLALPKSLLPDQRQELLRQLRASLDNSITKDRTAKGSDLLSQQPDSAVKRARTLMERYVPR